MDDRARVLYENSVPSNSGKKFLAGFATWCPLVRWATKALPAVGPSKVASSQRRQSNCWQLRSTLASVAVAKVGVVSSSVFSFVVRVVLVTRWCCIMCLRNGFRAVRMIASQRMQVYNLCSACRWVSKENGLGRVFSQTEQVKRFVAAIAVEGKLAMEERSGTAILDQSPLLKPKNQMTSSFNNS